jgi:SPP1 family predicted phage head-tail adaptor
MIGKMDDRVQFRRRSLTDDGFNKVEVWADHGTPVWASRDDVSDAERFRNGSVEAVITARFVVRWSEFTAAITPKDRLASGGKDYDIIGIKETGGRRNRLELSVLARADT